MLDLGGGDAETWSEMGERVGPLSSDPKNFKTDLSFQKLTTDCSIELMVHEICEGVGIRKSGV